MLAIGATAGLIWISPGCEEAHTNKPYKDYTCIFEYDDQNEKALPQSARDHIYEVLDQKHSTLFHSISKRVHHIKDRSLACQHCPFDPGVYMVVLRVAADMGTIVNGVRLLNRADSYVAVVVSSSRHPWLPAFINMDENAVSVIQRAATTCVVTNLKGLSSQQFVFNPGTSADLPSASLLALPVVDCYISLVLDTSTIIALIDMDITAIFSAACGLSGSLGGVITHMTGQRYATGYESGYTCYYLPYPQNCSIFKGGQWHPKKGCDGLMVLNFLVPSNSSSRKIISDYMHMDSHFGQQQATPDCFFYRCPSLSTVHPQGVHFKETAMGSFLTIMLLLLASAEEVNPRDCCLSKLQYYECNVILWIRELATFYSEEYLAIVLEITPAIRCDKEQRTSATTVLIGALTLAVYTFCVMTDSFDPGIVSIVKAAASEKMEIVLVPIFIDIITFSRVSLSCYLNYYLFGVRLANGTCKLSSSTSNAIFIWLLAWPGRSYLMPYCSDGNSDSQASHWQARKTLSLWNIFDSESLRQHNWCFDPGSERLSKVYSSVEQGVRDISKAFFIKGYVCKGSYFGHQQATADVLTYQCPFLGKVGFHGVSQRLILSGSSGTIQLNQTPMGSFITILPLLILSWFFASCCVSDGTLVHLIWQIAWTFIHIFSKFLLCVSFL